MYSSLVIHRTIQEQLKKNNKQVPAGRVAESYLEQHFSDKILIFTDGSKDPDTGRTGAAVFIPHYKIHIKERTTDHLSVYTVELAAIILGLEWIEGNDHNNALIASDSWAALTSIKTMKSCRQDLIYKIHNLLHRMHNNDMTVCFIWVPAHVGIEENEGVDILAKQTLRSRTVDREIPLCRQRVNQ